MGGCHLQVFAILIMSEQLVGAGLAATKIKTVVTFGGGVELDCALFVIFLSGRETHNVTVLLYNHNNDMV